MSKKIKNTEIYKELQQYIDEIEPGIKLHFRGSKTYLRASAPVFYKSIVLSTAWYHDSLKKPEFIEYAKTSICHELAHIKNYVQKTKNLRCYEKLWRTLSEPFKILFYEIFIVYFNDCNFRFVDNYCVKSWYDEFLADYEGYKIYTKDSSGKELEMKKEYFLGKMKLVNERNTSKKKKATDLTREKTKSTHPTWEMRIEQIAKDDKLTIKDVEAIYYNYHYPTDNK